jgi:GTP pyrophosphokinase
MEMLYDFEFDEDSHLGKDPQEDLELLISECKTRDENLDLDAISEAFLFCRTKHGGQLRKSGLPYYLHPLKVALIIIQEMNFYDTPTIISSLLHDTLEDVFGEDRELERERRRIEINDKFGGEVLEMVESLTKIKHSNISLEADQAATYRKLFLALVKDVRVIIIKTADRLHNMRTLHYLRDDKQKTIARETLNFYTPITHRLGLTKVKMELEDRSLYFRDREAYEDIKTALSMKRRDFIQYIRVFSEQIQSSLKNAGIEHILTVVHKHIYEIYQMIQNGQTLDEIDNFYSMVITTLSNDKFDCYKAHGVLVNMFNPVEHLVDYIAQPKINWYQSLNTHLYGPDGKLVEVIIRTEEMDKVAEEGIASAYSLKAGRYRALEIPDTDLDGWGQWMQDMINDRGDEAPQLIWNSIKNNIFDSELTAYTPEGKAIKLPKRASPIDFAFSLSEDTGLHTISAKVNGQIKPLNYEIVNGDKISVITSPNSHPKSEWQYFVTSYKAEVALHNYFSRLPQKSGEKSDVSKDMVAKLRIRGEDRPGMLHEITEAVEQSNIIRISLDSSEARFDGVLSIHLADIRQLNRLYAKLLSIRGINNVEQLDENT